MQPNVPHRLGGGEQYLGLRDDVRRWTAPPELVRNSTQCVSANKVICAAEISFSSLFSWFGAHLF